MEKFTHLSHQRKTDGSPLHAEAHAQLEEDLKAAGAD